jgi:DNA adenine methylase
MPTKKTMKLTPPCKWHGGKSYLADRIIERMPRHLVHCEPYFGAGQVFFKRDPADPSLFWDGPTSDGSSTEGVSEVIGDINGNLMNL